MCFNRTSKKNPKANVGSPWNLADQIVPKKNHRIHNILLKNPTDHFT